MLSGHLNKRWFDNRRGKQKGAALRSLQRNRGDEVSFVEKRDVAEQVAST